MVRMFGKALVATWRPYESGGGSHMRSSQMECDSVTVVDQVVLAQHPDGFWETFPLGNCSIIWSGKPTVSVIENGKETELSISGRDNTLADQLTQSAHKQLRFSNLQPASASVEEEAGVA